MKRILTACMVACMATCMVVQADDRNDKAFMGVRVDDGTTVTMGIVKHLTGALNLISYTSLGRYSSISTEIAAIKSLENGMYVGVLIGPNVDFGNKGSETPLTYLTAATGFLCGYSGDIWGGAAFIKYKQKLDNATTYIDGWDVGGAITYVF